MYDWLEAFLYELLLRIHQDYSHDIFKSSRIPPEIPSKMSLGPWCLQNFSRIHLVVPFTGFLQKFPLVFFRVSFYEVFIWTSFQDLFKSIGNPLRIDSKILSGIPFKVLLGTPSEFLQIVSAGMSSSDVFFKDFPKENAGKMKSRKEFLEETYKKLQGEFLSKLVEEFLKELLKEFPMELLLELHKGLLE